MQYELPYTSVQDIPMIELYEGRYIVADGLTSEARPTKDLQLPETCQMKPHVYCGWIMRERN